MITINTISATRFSFNGVTYHKNFMPFVTGNKIAIINVYDGCITLTDAPTIFSDYTVNGVTYSSVNDLQSALLDVIYTRNSLTNAAITLTTTGNSGAATLTGITLNIPNYTLAGLGGVGGTGTTNFLPKFTGASTLGNSLIFDNGTNVGIGTTNPLLNLQINSASGLNSTLAFSENNSLKWYNRYNAGTGSFEIVDIVNASARLVVQNNGNVGIGTTSPAQKLSINGNAQVDEIFIGVTSSFLSGTTNAQIGWSGGFSGLTNGSLILQSRSNVATPIIFATETTEKMRINGNGNVGIGTTNPLAKLHVAGGEIRNSFGSGQGGENYFNIIDGISNGFRTIVSTSNQITYTFHNGANGAVLNLAESGAATFSNSVTATAFFASSDIRLKDIIAHDGDMITYKWKDGRDDKIHYGYSAQNLQSINPNLVNKNDDGFLSVNYTETLVLKVRELEKEVQLLKAQIN